MSNDVDVLGKYTFLLANMKYYYNCFNIII